VSGLLKVAQHFSAGITGKMSKPKPVKRATDMECGDLSPLFKCDSKVVMRFECGTRILRVIHGRDARATLSNCTTTDSKPQPSVSRTNFSFTLLIPAMNRWAIFVRPLRGLG
jgi:hypothetical protein